jgi:class 3 adenylate cyclase
MQCPQCQADNDAGLRFCESCGAKLARLCPSCGHELKPQAKFCGQCGASPSESAAPPPAVSTPDEHDPRRRDTKDGERRQLTVLFCDLVGSTPLSQQLDAEEWRDLIAQYQQAASGAVGRFGGHVAKNLGDGLLIYFGWPTAREDDPERAVRAGLEIVEAVRSLDTQPEKMLLRTSGFDLDS